MKIICIASLKGGVGKTTLAINLALHLSMKGNTLVCDLDPNNNLTDFFLRDSDPDSIDSANALHVLTKQKTLADCIHPLEANLSVLPATVALNRLAAETASNPSGLLTFRTALKKTDFDYIVIDTAPYAGPELRAALWASHLVLSPVAPVRWIVQGTQFLSEEIETAAEVSGQKPEVLLVPSMVGSSQKEQDRLDVLRQYYPVTDARIKKAESIRKATENGKQLKDGSQHWQSFADLTAEVLTYG